MPHEMFHNCKEGKHRISFVPDVGSRLQWFMRKHSKRVVGLAKVSNGSSPRMRPRLSASRVNRVSVSAPWASDDCVSRWYSSRRCFRAAAWRAVAAWERTALRQEPSVGSPTWMKVAGPKPEQACFGMMCGHLSDSALVDAMQRCQRAARSGLDQIRVVMPRRTSTVFALAPRPPGSSTQKPPELRRIVRCQGSPNRIAQ